MRRPAYWLRQHTSQRNRKLCRPAQLLCRRTSIRKKSYIDLPNGCIDAPSIKKNLILSKFHAFETRKLEERNKLVLQSS